MGTLTKLWSLSNGCWCWAGKWVHVYAESSGYKGNLFDGKCFDWHICKMWGWL